MFNIVDTHNIESKARFEKHPMERNPDRFHTHIVCSSTPCVFTPPDIYLVLVGRSKPDEAPTAPVGSSQGLFPDWLQKAWADKVGGVGKINHAYFAQVMCEILAERGIDLFELGKTND